MKRIIIIVVVPLFAIAALSFLGCTAATETTTTTTSAVATTTSTTSASTTSTAAASTTTTAASATSTTTTTSTTATTILTSGTAVLNYVGGTHLGESFVFETQTITYESIFDFNGDIINIGSFLAIPPTTEGAGIIDMGTAALTAIASAPASGYSSGLDLIGEDAVGHVACVRTKSGKYAKIRIASHEAGDNTSFTFDWVFRTDGERTF